MQYKDDVTIEYDSCDDYAHLTFITGIYKGINYKYGRVWFEDENSPVLSFEYDIIGKPVGVEIEDKDDFGQLIGKILTEILEEQLTKKEVVYSGGTGNDIMVEDNQETNEPT